MSRLQNVQVPVDAIDRNARRGGWLLIGAFVAFVAFVAMIIATNGDFDRASQEAADRLGVPLADLPADVIAPISNQYANTPGLVLLGVIVMLSFGLFIVGVLTLGHIGGGNLATSAVVLAALTPLCWLGILGLEAGISADNPGRSFLDLYDAIYASPPTAPKQSCKPATPALDDSEGQALARNCQMRVRPVAFGGTTAAFGQW